MTGGKHFIISTSLNGRGPVHFRKWINRGKQHLAHASTSGATR